MKRMKYIKPDLTVIKLSSQQHLLGLSGNVTPPVMIDESPELEFGLEEIQPFL